MQACLSKQLVLCCCDLRLRIQKMNEKRKTFTKLCPALAGSHRFTESPLPRHTVRYQLQTRRTQMLAGRKTSIMRARFY